MARQTILERDEQVLAAALLGYQLEKKRIDDAIVTIQNRLRRQRTNTVGRVLGNKPRKPHLISPEGRARIVAAQRRRWKKAKAASNGA